MTAFRLDHLKIDPVTYAIAGSAILGIRDSGKTYTATFLAERLFDAGIPFIAFDPIGVWRFLRVPGSGAGYPIVVAGGQEGDLSLTPASAPAIVEAAMQNGISLVIDLFSIDLSKADWRRIVRDSVRLLLHKNSRYGLRHIFIEEASEFVPQQVRDGEVYAEVEKLARMGGNAHLGYTLVNQRAEEVNKAVLELCDNLFLHRQKGRNSLTALSKWLDIGNVKDHREIIDSLSTLPTGECWAWLGGSERPERVKVPEKRSLHPDRRITREGKKLEAKAVDVGQFVATLREALPVIEKEAAQNDPKTLRARIAELERAGHAPPADPEALHREYARGKIDGYGAAIAALVPVVDRMQTLRTALDEQLGGLIDDLGKWKSRQENQATSAETTQNIRGNTPARLPLKGFPGPRPPRPVHKGHAHGNGTADPSVGTGGLRRILIALAQRPQGLTQRQVGVRAGLSSRSGTFSNYLAKARKAGWIQGEGQQVLTITPAGVAALGEYEPLPTGQALLEHWLGELGASGAARILREAAKAFPRALSYESLGERAEISHRSGTFSNYLGKLRALELIDGRRGEVRASEELFG